MKSAVEAESLINASIERMKQKGFKLRPGMYGDDRCGCAIGAFMQDQGEKKAGESAKTFAARIFDVQDEFIWAFVCGFDGKGVVHRVGFDRDQTQAWNDAGLRVARQWLG